MKNINYDFVLEQIYNFLLLRPDFNSKKILRRSLNISEL